MTFKTKNIRDRRQQLQEACQEGRWQLLHINPRNVLTYRNLAPDLVPCQEGRDSGPPAFSTARYA